MVDIQIFHGKGGDMDTSDRFKPSSGDLTTSRLCSSSLIKISIICTQTPRIRTVQTLLSVIKPIFIRSDTMPWKDRICLHYFQIIFRLFLDYFYIIFTFFLHYFYIFFNIFLHANRFVRVIYDDDEGSVYYILFDNNNIYHYGAPFRVLNPNQIKLKLEIFGKLETEH